MRHRRIRPMSWMLPAPAIVGAQPCLAFAHEATAGQHGGPVADVNGHRVELLGAELQLSIYLSDENGNPTAVRGVSGRATIMQGGKTETIARLNTGSLACLSLRQIFTLQRRTPYENHSDDRHHTDPLDRPPHGHGGR
jgi:hypothetical protein